MLEALAATRHRNHTVTQLAVRAMPGSGRPEQLLEAAGLSATAVAGAARALLP